MDMLFTVEFLAGTDIKYADEEAIRVAYVLQCGIKFRFNDVECTVWPGDTWAELTRQYRHALKQKGAVKMAFGR